MDTTVAQVVGAVLLDEYDGQVKRHSPEYRELEALLTEEVRERWSSGGITVEEMTQAESLLGYAAGAALVASGYLDPLRAQSYWYGQMSIKELIDNAIQPPE